MPPFKIRGGFGCESLRDERSRVKRSVEKSKAFGPRPVQVIKLIVKVLFCYPYGVIGTVIGTGKRVIR
jgi:hypothetical protein